VRDLRNNGTLKRSSSNANLIVMSSVLAYQQTRQNAVKNDGKNTDDLPVITTEQATQNTNGSDEANASKAASNGRSKETQPLAVDNLVPMEV
jgi:hypothetical protein